MDYQIINIQLDPEIHEAVVKLTERERLNISDYISGLLMNDLGLRSGGSDDDSGWRFVDSHK